MASKTEYFNAKFAGDYLGDQWVVRGSDFDRLESYHHRLREALEYLLEQHPRNGVYHDCTDNGLAECEYCVGVKVLAELDNMENGS